jgi:hypothetical protein
MTVTPVQRRVAQILQVHRGPRRYVGGGLALNLRWPRLSDDMDVYVEDMDETTNEILIDTVQPEIDRLEANGLIVHLECQDEWMVEATVSWYGHETKIQWLNDEHSCLRFLEAIRDPVLGFRLHAADVAVNKVQCASWRNQAPRDAVDLYHIVAFYAPLGPLIHAQIGKGDPRSPRRIIDDLRQNVSEYSERAIRAVRFERDREGVNRATLRDTVNAALDGAQEYLEDIAPVDDQGALFLDANDVPYPATADDVESETVRIVKAQRFQPTPQFAASGSSHSEL